MRRVLGVVMVTLLAGATLLANQKQQHNDVFVSGPPNETQLARQIRHNLLMLPYYTIFDDLYFQVNGSVVTLKGACPP